MADATRTEVAEVLCVRDLMQRDPITVDRNASVQDLAELLFYHGIGGVPVVERGTRVVGVVSASDIVRVAAEQKETPTWYLDATGQPKPSAYFAGEGSRLVRGVMESSLPMFRVEDIMMPATFSVREEATLPELAAFLVRAGVHRALVMEEGLLRGVVTSMDVLRAIASDTEPVRGGGSRR
jgi:CBS domain-containing protein